MAEVLWKNILICAALEDQYVKSEVYKPNCKSVYQLNLQKKHLCYVNESERTNDRYCLLLMMETMQWGNNRFHQISRPERGFEFSRLNSVLSWAFSRYDKRIKTNGIKVIFKFWTLNYVDCVPFLCIDIFQIVHSRTNLLKISSSWISEKNDQTSINLTKVFNFIG